MEYAGWILFAVAAAMAIRLFFSHSRARAEVYASQQFLRLQKPEAELHKLMNQSPIAYYELDESGRFTFINPREIDLRGLPENEIMGQFFWDLEPLPVQPRYREDTLRKLHGRP